jgi:lipopolysaccharide cholinephosphotransferase
LDKVFKSKDIKYWIDFGTLLGAERHGGIIPWDDDADICVRVKDLPKIEKLGKVFAKYGLVLTKREPQPWKLHFPDQLHYCVDIFFISDVPNSTDGELTFYSNWAGHWYLSDVEPRRKIPFGPITVFAPNWPWRRLEEQYGPDCMHKAMFHSHIYGDLPYKVTIVDFSPAEYKIDPNHKIIRLD